MPDAKACISIVPTARDDNQNVAAAGTAATSWTRLSRLSPCPENRRRSLPEACEGAPS